MWPAGIVSTNERTSPLGSFEVQKLSIQGDSKVWDFHLLWMLDLGHSKRVKRDIQSEPKGVFKGIQRTILVNLIQRDPPHVKQRLFRLKRLSMLWTSTGERARTVFMYKRHARELIRKLAGYISWIYEDRIFAHPASIYEECSSPSVGFSTKSTKLKSVQLGFLANHIHGPSVRNQNIVYM